MMVHRGGGEQRRNRRPLGVHPAIGEDQNGGAGGDGGVRPGAQVIQRRAQRPAAAGGREQRGQGHRAVGAGIPVQGAQPLQLLGRQHRALQPHLAAALGPRLQQIALRAEGDHRGGNQFLADGVDRRIGDLREELPEVVVEELGSVGEGCRRRVVAHGADRLDGVAGHRLQNHAQVFEGVAEGALLPLARAGVQPRRLRAGGKLLQVYLIVAQPQRVVMLSRDGALQLRVVDDAPLAGVHQQHAAGPQAVLAHDLLGRQVEHPHLGGQHHQPASGYAVAGGPQSVAVQHRSHLNAVGEGHRRGAVPRLHQRRVVLVERLLLRAHALVVGPRLGDQQHERVRQRAPAEHHQLQGVVELGGITAGGVDHRQRGGQIISEQLGTEARLPRAHPVLIASQRVDFAIVHQVAVGVGAVPTRERVGREAGVHQGNGRLHRRMVQLGVEAAQLVGGQHAFVDHGAVRHAGDVALRVRRQGLPDPVLQHLADHVEAPLEGLIVVHAAPAPDVELADVRPHGARRGTQGGRLGRHVAPAEQRLAILRDDLGGEARH